MRVHVGITAWRNVPWCLTGRSSGQYHPTYRWLAASKTSWADANLASAHEGNHVSPTSRLHHRVPVAEPRIMMGHGAPPPNEENDLTSFTHTTTQNSCSVPSTWARLHPGGSAVFLLTLLVLMKNSARLGFPTFAALGKGRPSLDLRRFD